MAREPMTSNVVDILEFPRVKIDKNGEPLSCYKLKETVEGVSYDREIWATSLDDAFHRLSLQRKTARTAKTAED